MQERESGMTDSGGTRNRVDSDECCANTARLRGENIIRIASARTREWAVDGLEAGARPAAVWSPAAIMRTRGEPVPEPVCRIFGQFKSHGRGSQRSHFPSERHSVEMPAP